MTNGNSEKATSSYGNNKTRSANRRSVIQAVAALGIGGSVLGTASATGSPGGDDNADHDNGNDKCESSGVLTSIQTWTLRELPDTVPGLIRRVGAVGNNGGPSYDGIGLTSLGEASQSELSAALNQTELDVSNAHVGIGQLEENYEETVDPYIGIGVQDLVHSYIPPAALETVEKTEEIASRMNSVADKLADEGMRYGLHNHFQEFRELDDGRTPLEVLDENLNENVIFELDVGWVMVAGHDPAQVIERYSDRTDLIHMKDMIAVEDFSGFADAKFAEIGEGDVDMREVARVSRNVANVDYLIYEHDAPDNPAGSAATGAGVLSLLDGAPGPEGISLEDMGGPDYSGELRGEEKCQGVPGRGNPSEQGRQNRRAK